MSTHHDVQALPAEQREHILRGFGLGWWRQLGQVAIVLGVVLLACWYVGLLDATTLLNGLPSIATLAGEAMPPDFSGYRSWIRPLIDTLAMSIAGTAIAVVFSLVVAFVAARNTAPHPLVFGVARVLLNALRSVPELIMGIIFVLVIAWVAVSPWLEFMSGFSLGGRIGVGVLWGLVAVSMSPAAVLAVLAETRAWGPVTSHALGTVVVLDDVVVTGVPTP